MILDRCFSKIVALVSKDPTRAIRNLYLDREHSRLVATDGAALAIVPVTGVDRDVPGQVSPQTIQDAAKALPKGQPINVDTGSAEHAAWSLNAEICARWPMYESVLPVWDKNNRGVVRVALDAEKLLALARALDANRDKKQPIVELAINLADPYSPILVDPRTNSGAKGILMLARLDEGVEEYEKRAKKMAEGDK